MKQINPKVFKAYDIRGIYSSEIDKDFAFLLGRAFAEMIKQELKQDKVEITVGHDMRLSSPKLTASLIDGLKEQGADVVNIGLASTPTFYFAVAKYDHDAGIQVSASHNPAEYNGFKMVRKSAMPISADSGIETLKEMVLASKFNKVFNQGFDRELKGMVAEHVKFALTYADLNKIKPFKIVVDTANGMGGPMFEELFKYLPCELIKLNFKLDGTFPAHEADPLKDENNKQLQETVIKEKADLGITLDGDADRIFFITNEGITVEPAIIRGILSQIFLRDNPGAKICYDIRPGRITIDMIEEAGGISVVTRVGHSFIKEKAREVGAIFAGESSGHFFLKMPFGFFEAPMIMALKILQELSETGKTLAEYVKPLYRYYHSGEINFEVKDKQAVLDKLKEKYKNNLEYDFDGLSFEWPDWWFNVRPSNTENKLRLNLEATTEKTMKEKTMEVEKLIKEN